MCLGGIDTQPFPLCEWGPQSLPYVTQYEVSVLEGMGLQRNITVAWGNNNNINQYGVMTVEPNQVEEKFRGFAQGSDLTLALRVSFPLHLIREETLIMFNV